MEGGPVRGAARGGGHEKQKTTAPPPPRIGNALKDAQANVDNLPEYLLKRFVYSPPVGSPSPPRHP